MDDAKIRGALTQFKKITVVGLSPDPGRVSYGVTRYMMEQGYEITGVRPGASELMGRPCYGSVAEVPGPLEIVNVFRASEHVSALVDELIALGPQRPQVLWLQEGVTDPAAESRAREAGITVFSDLCILKEHARLV